MALDGLAPRRRKSSAHVKVPAARLPVAQVVIDVQAANLGQAFDYLVEDKHSDSAVPGMSVRVRFGGRLVNGIIWDRVESSSTPRSSLKFIERVIGSSPVAPRQMRRDIEEIADYFAGTRANIIRLAIPSRVAKVDKEPQPAVARPVQGKLPDSARKVYEAQTRRVEASYGHIDDVERAWSGSSPAGIVWNAMPGVTAWADDIVWLISRSFLSQRPIIVELPDIAHIRLVHQQLQATGFLPFALRSGRGVWNGDYCILAGAMTPEERYRSYMAVAQGAVQCVIGTRAAMYAPVQGNAVFVAVDDIAYQNADGFTPYANVRDVMRLRARGHKGIFVALGHSRSPQSQWEVLGRQPGDAAIEVGQAIEVSPLPAPLKKAMPWVRLFNREELERLADPAIGARIPHTAVSILKNALRSGPVLLCVPHDGQSMVFICSRCRRQARCLRCSGPLQQGLRRDGSPRCAWCGAAASQWSCPHCGGSAMRVIRVGALGTAQELRGLFPRTRIVTSTPNQPRGIIERIEDRPQVVIASPGAEPQIVSTGLTRMEHREGIGVEKSDTAYQNIDGAYHPSYRAVAIVDTWTSLYASHMDSRIDILTAWMRAAALCASHEDGGQVLLLGECEPAIAQSLIAWDPSYLARKEVEERKEAGMPPSVTAANIWGRREVVEWVLKDIGADIGAAGAESDLALLPSGIPSVLGPVPIPEPSNISDRQLEGSNDRVRAVVRASLDRTGTLSRRLRSAAAKHAASRVKGELHIQIDPKNLS